MGLQTYSYVQCDGCGKWASDPLFSDDAAAKVADMRGYQVDAEGHWLCPKCQKESECIPVSVAIPGCRIAS